MSLNSQPFNWSEHQERDYGIWAETSELYDIKIWVRQQFKSHLLTESYDRQITFLDRPLQSGFHIKTTLWPWPANFAHHLFYYLFLRIKGIDYVNQLKDSRGQNEKRIDRLYFKPSIYRLLKNPTRNRLYGNITIEKTVQHDQVISISLQCDRYAQRGDEFDPFEELMDYLFSEN